MKTIEQAAEAYAIGLAESNVSPHKPKIEIAIDAFKDGFRLAEEWISVKDELPEIKHEPYQVLGMMKVNGQCETYWVEYSNGSILRECSHWKPINRK